MTAIQCTHSTQHHSMVHGLPSAKTKLVLHFSNTTSSWYFLRPLLAVHALPSTSMTAILSLLG
jgi:hypothetical protein